MRINKTNQYVTKEEAILAMRSGRDREEMEWAISAIPSTKVKRSLKITPTFKAKGLEVCPHCHRHVDVYNLSKDVGKFAYCWRCGGALYRPHARGLYNPSFDYKMLTPEQAEKWKVERYVN